MCYLNLWFYWVKTIETNLKEKEVQAPKIWIGFLIINDFIEAVIDWLLTNQQISETLPELLYDVRWALRSDVALRWNPNDVTQQAR